MGVAQTRITCSMNREIKMSTEGIKGVGSPNQSVVANSQKREKEESTSEVNEDSVVSHTSRQISPDQASRAAEQIAQNLGIGAPEKAKICLDCHATHIEDASLKGEKFSIEDGVSCESCHGAAEKWIGPHTAKNASHARGIMASRRIRRRS